MAQQGGSHRSVVNSRKLTAKSRTRSRPNPVMGGWVAVAVCSGSPGGNGGWMEDVVGTGGGG